VILENQDRVWLKSKRKEAGYTQLKLAMKLGISRSSYSMYEQGRRDPSLSVAIDISLLLNFHWTLFYENKLNKTCNLEVLSHN